MFTGGNLRRISPEAALVLHLKEETLQIVSCAHELTLLVKGKNAASYFGMLIQGLSLSETFHLVQIPPSKLTHAHSDTFLKDTVGRKGLGDQSGAKCFGNLFSIGFHSNLNTVTGAFSRVKSLEINCFSIKISVSAF